MKIKQEQLEALLILKGKKIEPPIEPLKSALNRLPDVVTKKIDNRYLYSKNIKGRRNNIIVNINNIMSNFTKKILPVGLVAVAVFAMGYWYLGDKAVVPKQAPTITIESVLFADSQINQAVNEVVGSAINGDELLDFESMELYFLDQENEASVNIDNIAYLYEQ